MEPLYQALGAETSEQQAVLREKVRHARAAVGSLPLIDDSESVIALLYVALTHARLDGARLPGVLQMAVTTFGAAPVHIREIETQMPYEPIAPDTEGPPEQARQDRERGLGPRPVPPPVRVLHASMLADRVVAWLADQQALATERMGPLWRTRLTDELTAYLRSLIGEGPGQKQRKDVH